MFLVQKSNLPFHFRSSTNKSTHIPKNYQLAARLFDEKVILHLKTLDLTNTSLNSNISLSWLSSAVSFLSTVHTEAEEQISNLKSEADDFQVLYFDYSMKVLDLCNLISSAVNKLTDRRLLMNFSLRLLNFTGQIPSNEKLNKAKDAIDRSVNVTRESGEKGVRAKALIEELTILLDKLPRGKVGSGRDLIRRSFYALGVLTVFIGSVLVNVLFGGLDSVEFKLRVPVEFLWSDSVNGMQDQIFDRIIKSEKIVILEVDEVSRQAVVVRDIIEAVVSDGGGNDDVRVRLEAGVSELVSSVKKFSDGVDRLTNGVNGLFHTVLKTRNGRLDSLVASVNTCRSDY